jgi:hypothetical protein
MLGFVLKIDINRLAARVDSYGEDMSVRIRLLRLQPDTDHGSKLTVGVQSVRVSVSQSTGSSERGGGRVTVTVVLGAGAVDSGSVGLLVKDGGSLVLGVARAGKSRELVEEQRAVGDVVVGGQGVSEDVGGAATVDVGAVSAGLATSGGGTVAGNGAQTSSDSAAGAGGGGLEVGLESAGGAGGGGSGSGSGQPVAVGEGSADGRQLGAGAVTLDGSALGEGLHGGLNLSGLGSVDVDGEVVALVGQDGAGEGSRVGLGVLDGTLGEDVVGAALGQVVELGDLDVDLDGLTACNGLEGVLGERVGGHALEHAEESGLGGCSMLVLNDGDGFLAELTVGGDGKLVGRGIVKEGSLVEQLVASLVVVGKGNLDLAVLDLGQGDGERRVPLLQVEGSRADRGHEGGESGGGDLHVVGC